VNSSTPTTPTTPATSPPDLPTEPATPQEPTAAPPLAAPGGLGPMIKALRPKQWTKNGVLFAALIFSFHFEHPMAWWLALKGFVAFSLLSSAGYIINDIRDREADRRHPSKRNRPIASGRLSLPNAVIETVVIGLLGLLVATSLGWGFLAVSLCYLATTLSYSAFFKHTVILDVMMLSMGFIWRAVAGAVAIRVNTSPWFLLCVSFLALFLGFNKRRGELRLAESENGGTRRILAEYNTAMIREYQALTTSGTVLTYALYTIQGSPTPWLILTIPYVLYGIFRYIYLVDRKGEGGAPDETLFKDRPLLATCVLYIVTTVLVLLWAPARVA
jgi:4-hydroxybenzoate polyprenyltransferase